MIKTAKHDTKVICVVPQAHFDLIWRRPIKWYRSRRREIFMNALDLLREIPEFRFTFCQAMAVRDFLEDEPGERSRMQKFIDEGRLEITGSPMAIPDLNLISGEALVRNQIDGLRWVEETFGVRSKIALLEDAFGVPSTLPQILSKCGFHSYRASRMPRPDTPPPEGPYIWEGVDGTQIPTLGFEGMAWGYGVSPNVDDPPRTYEQKVAQMVEDLTSNATSAASSQLFSLLGEEHILDKESLRAFCEAANSLDLDIQWVTFAEYVQQVKDAKLWEGAPVENDDFSRLFTGCYTTRIGQKHLIAEMEARLLALENLKAVGATELQDGSRLWDKLFLLQFHDAIGGCHTPDNARFIEDTALKSLSVLESGAQGDRMVNPLPYPRRVPFIFEGFAESASDQAEPVQDLDGNLIGCSPWGPFETKPSEVKKVDVQRGAQAMIEGDGGRLRLCLESEKPCLLHEGTLWKNLGGLRLREDVGTLWTEDYTGREWRETSEDSALKIVERGHVFNRAVWEGSLECNNQLWPGFSSLKWRKSVLLFNDGPYLWIRYELDWRGNSTEISWSFGAQEATSLDYFGSAPFGHTKRRAYDCSKDTLTGDVYPSPRWTSFGGHEGYWTILHGGNPAFRAVPGGVENVLLRSPVKRWTPPFPVLPDPTSWDNGVHIFDFLLVPSQDFDPAETARMSWSWLTPPQRNKDFSLDSNLRLTLQATPPSLVITSVKRQGENEWTLRVYEAEGKQIVWSLVENMTVLKMDFQGEPLTERSHEVLFKPFEICDLSIQWERPDR